MFESHFTKVKARHSLFQSLLQLWCRLFHSDVPVQQFNLQDNNVKEILPGTDFSGSGGKSLKRTSLTQHLLGKLEFQL